MNTKRTALRAVYLTGGERDLLRQAIDTLRHEISGCVGQNKIEKFTGSYTSKQLLAVRAVLDAAEAKGAT